MDNEMYLALKQYLKRIGLGGEQHKSITWDGVVKDGDIVVSNSEFYKYIRVSDVPLTKNQLIGNYVEFYSDGFMRQYLDDSFISIHDNYLGIANGIAGFSVFENNTTIGGVTFPYKGVYFCFIESINNYVSCLTYTDLIPISENNLPFIPKYDTPITLNSTTDIIEWDYTESDASKVTVTETKAINITGGYEGCVAVITCYGGVLDFSDTTKYNLSATFNYIEPLEDEHITYVLYYISGKWDVTAMVYTGGNASE